MSISNFFNKIKGHSNIDNLTIVYLIIIIAVGISSFFVGRWSYSFASPDDNYINIENLKNVENGEGNDSMNINYNLTSSEKNYVASKNGKMYYTLGCSGAKRIKPENQIWFSTKEEAEKSGYALSKTCK